MTKAIQTIISADVAQKLYDLISNPDDNMCPEFLEDEEIIKRLHSIKMSLLNHNEVIEQNRQLQTELNNKNKELKNLKELPFFPYALNSGNRTDFGEFYLISHAWFSISNFPIQLGIVEVEWKSSGVRKMYLGAGSTNGKNFKQDVLSIALHGQKIKDSSEV